MEAIKQSVRPKHQVLILKCFPKLPKNSSADEIKPKGSELSYLLYYASSRRSKLTKVGTFLEKKTAHDLSKGRTATVQITLQILNAFLNNPAISGTGAQGFGLFAPYVLRILRDVLRDAAESQLVETAVPTWDSFCRHQDHIALNADREFRQLFEEVVRLWAGYATKDQIPGQSYTRRTRMKAGVADNVKLRMAGLKALKSTADSDTLVSEAGRQLKTVMPVVLQNLYDGDGDLDQIVHLSAQLEAQEKEKGKPRPSTSADGEQRDAGDVRTADRSVAEADRIIDQEASILALRCLKSIFAFESRTQIRIATTELLTFTLAHRPNPIKAHSAQDQRLEDEWAIRLFQTVCTWVPVQDRFVALFSAVDFFVSDNVTQQDLHRQLLLAKIISHLLSADINFIGISVIDFLLSFIRLMAHIASEDTTSIPATNGAKVNDSNINVIPPTPMTATTANANGERKAPIRTRLLQELQCCVSNLAVHVYYTDQISDMIIAILARIRPDANRFSHIAASPRPPSSSVAGSQATAEDGSPPMSELGTSNGHASASRSSFAGFYFNSPAKREIALNAVYSILLRANDTQEDGDALSTNRNPVPVAAWEGSQWILKDQSESVRGAYVNAFGAWLELELPKLTLEKALQDEKKSEAEAKRKSLNSDLARRAANTASARKAAGKRSQTAVLQSIHLMAVDLLAAAQDTEAQAASNGTSHPSELQTLAAKLAQVSQRLQLMDLDEFRNTQVPSIPLYSASPKPGTTLHPSNESDTDSPSRQPSSASASFVRPPNPRTRSHSARRSPSLTGSLARPQSSARQDFAIFQAGRLQPGSQVEDLKRLLSPSSAASLSTSGLGNAVVAKRAVSVTRGPQSFVDNDTASESLADWEGSWAGSSFVGTPGEDEGVDVRKLLDSLPSVGGEVAVGAGPPV